MGGYGINQVGVGKQPNGVSFSLTMRASGWVTTRERGKRPLSPWSLNLVRVTRPFLKAKALKTRCGLVLLPGRKIYRLSLTVPSVTSAPFRYSPLIDSVPFSRPPSMRLLLSPTT